MTDQRNSLFVFVAACAIAVMACQPVEGPAEHVGKDIDKAAKKIGDQIDKTADKANEALNDAKK